jgi:hypothetical protein
LRDGELALHRQLFFVGTGALHRLHLQFFFGALPLSCRAERCLDLMPLRDHSLAGLQLRGGIAA